MGKGKSKTIWLETWNAVRREAGRGTGGKGRIQIGFDIGLGLRKSNSAKAFNSKQENGKETYLGSNINVEYS